LPAFLVLTASLIAISAIDLEHFIIPNKIVYPTGYAGVILLALAALLEHDWAPFGRGLLGGLAAFTFFFLLHLAVPAGMGFGDVRLSAVLGLFLGWLGWGYVLGGLFTGFLYGAVIGMLLIAFGRRGRRQHIPFGPFLAAGTMTFVLFGAQIINWRSNLGR
jgi:leader peptidase (prepilin peptidase)/N-methyltransferase